MISSQHLRLDTLFKDIAVKFPNKVAITTGNEQLTYKELNEYLAQHQLPNEFNYFDPTKGDETRECGLHN